MPVQRTASGSKAQAEKKTESKRPKSTTTPKKGKSVTPNPTTQTSLTLRSISASILVDGERLPCYEIEYSKLTRTATCFVESQVGKSYMIQLRREPIPAPGRSKTKPKPADLELDVYFDGIHSPYSIGLFERDDKDCFINGEYCHEGLRPLQFSRVQTTDDESAAVTKSPAADIGSVKIKLTVVKVTEKKTFADQKLLSTAVDQVVVNEKTKLAGQHATSFGPPEDLAGMSLSWFDAEALDQPNNDPYLTFIFRYRPRDVLIANGVIPKEETVPLPDNRTLSPPTHVKQESNMDESDESDIEILQAEAREAAAHAALLAAKLEKATLLRAKSKKMQKGGRFAAIKNEDGILDMTHL